MAESMEKPFGHEPDAINYRTILICGGILAAVVVGIAVGLHFLMADAVIPNYAEIVTRPGKIPPPPRLQPHPQTDLATFRAGKEALLSEYQWTDRQHTFARIPIQRAMQIYAAQHAHAAAASSVAPASASSAAAQGAQ